MITKVTDFMRLLVHLRELPHILRASVTNRLTTVLAVEPLIALANDGHVVEMVATEPAFITLLSVLIDQVGIKELRKPFLCITIIDKDAFQIHAFEICILPSVAAR